MKIVKPNAVLINQNTGNPYKVIELAGRTCYKSNDKITDSSAIAFCSGMKKSGHWAMLEHGLVHLMFTFDSSEQMANFNKFVAKDPDKFRFINMTMLKDYIQVILTGSFRGWLEFLDNKGFGQNEFQKAIQSVLGEKFPDMFEFPGIYHTTRQVNILSDDDVILKLSTYYAVPEENKRAIMKHIYHTVIFTCDRGVTHEFVRHRPCSFAQESTRYCNYSKDKFGGEITVVEPCSLKDNPEMFDEWKKSCEAAEKAYFKLLKLGAQPQAARGVLPTDLKTEIVITANETEWQHIINLRYHGLTGKPHPHMVEAMTLAYPLLVEDSNERLS